LVFEAQNLIGVLGLNTNLTRENPFYPQYFDEGHDCDTYIDHLVSTGRISTTAFSMWLGNAEATSGSVLFGTIDQSRYTGNLVRTPLIKDKSTLIVDSNGTSKDGSPIICNDETKFPLRLEIGVTEPMSWLPDAMARPIAEAFGASYNSVLQRFTIPCDAAKYTNATLDIQLVNPEGGPILHVEAADLIVSPMDVISRSRYGNYGHVEYLEDQDPNICIFGIQS